MNRAVFLAAILLCTSRAVAVCDIPLYGIRAHSVPRRVYRPAPVQRTIYRTVIRKPALPPQIRLAPTQRLRSTERTVQAESPLGQIGSQPNNLDNSLPPANTTPNTVRQPTVQQPVATESAPSAPTQGNQPPQQPQVTDSKPAPQSETPRKSALAMLAGRAAPSQRPVEKKAPEVSAAPSQPVAQHIGAWTVTLPNNSQVVLTLDKAGSFTWVATKDGKASQFDGTFSVADGTLTLSRSSDNQKLIGKLTISDQGFNFKLNGAKDNGLNFTRQS